MTTTTVPLSFEAATLPALAEEVIASDDGIFLVLHGDGAPIGQLWDQPTAIAFMVGEDLVVAQGSRISNQYPRRPQGPILVFDPAGVRALPIGEEELTLFDAGVVDGQPVALATSWTGGNPDDKDERLLLIDLITGDRSDLGSVGWWEAGVSQARLVSGKILLVLFFQENLIETRSSDGTLEWAIPAAFDGVYLLNMAVKDTELTSIDPGFQDPDFTPVITITRYDLEDGSQLGTETITLDDGVYIGGGFCWTAEWRGEGLLCDQSYGQPLLIDVFRGAVSHFGGFASGVPTVPRAGSTPSG